MAESAEKSPIDQALDLFVYAPLGLALIARDQLPALIARGRQQVTSQMALAKMMGQYAVREGEKEAKKQVQRIETRATERPLVMPSPTPDATPADIDFRTRRFRNQRQSTATLGPNAFGRPPRHSGIRHALGLASRPAPRRTRV